MLRAQVCVSASVCVCVCLCLLVGGWSGFGGFGRLEEDFFVTLCDLRVCRRAPSAHVSWHDLTCFST